MGNIGDSRVLLGRADGSIFPGPGTDSGLTTDHKPDLASERERIERTGGNVQEARRKEFEPGKAERAQFPVVFPSFSFIFLSGCIGR